MKTDLDTPHPIKRYRAENGLTQEELAELAETTAATIARIETRGQRAGHELLIRLSDITGVSIDELVRASSEKETGE